MCIYTQADLGFNREVKVWVLRWYFNLDVNVMISITVAVHPPNAFAL